eukprot:Ihof_evm14s24 gene=Ihof_evmTU14s24
MGDIDYYQVLGLGPGAIEKEITKAYRKLALKYHPDKNPDKSAVKIFLELSSAYEILMDPKAKAAYDNLLRSRQNKIARNLQLDSKRRKLKEDLEEREREAERPKWADTPSTPGLSPEAAAKALAKEIERLRQEGFQRVQREQEQMQEEWRAQAKHKAALGKGEGEKEGVVDPKTALSRTLKIKWKPTEGHTYTNNELNTMLGKYGTIVHILVSTKKKGSAVVEFSEVKGARQAMALESNLKLTWIAGEPPLDPTPSPIQVDRPAADEMDYETAVLMRMRQTQRAKVEAE